MGSRESSLVIQALFEAVLMGWPELWEVTTNRMEAENTNKRGVEMEKPYKLHMQQSQSSTIIVL